MLENKHYVCKNDDTEKCVAFQWNGQTNRDEFPEFMKDLFDNDRIAFLTPKDTGKQLVFTENLSLEDEDPAWVSSVVELGNYIIDDCDDGIWIIESEYFIQTYELVK